VNKYQNSRSQGFALIISLGILAFVLLLLLSLTAFVRVETRVSENTITQLSARQNALLALHVALGELQKSTGPDQRVSAAADIAAAADGGRLSSGEVAQNTQSATGTENGLSVDGAASIQTGTRWWTGVWGRAGSSYSSSIDSVYSETPSPVLLNWLVSGNEGNDYTVDSDGWISENNSTNFTPGDAIDWSATGLSSSDPSTWTSTSGYADFEIKSSGQKAVLLVGPDSAGVSAIDGEDASERYVLAPLVDIDSSSNSNAVGRYAWWVGDEGTKASLTLADPYPGLNDPDANTTAGAQARLRLMSASRSGVELLSGWEDYPLADDTSATSQFERVNELSEIQYVISSLTTEVLGSSFHDLTRYASGLLTDTLNSGLRTDLTYYFESASNWNSSALKGEPIIPESYSPQWQNGESAPKWDWLYSFYNTNPSISSSSYTIRPETDTELGIAPVITQFRWIVFTENDSATLEEDLITNIKKVPEGTTYSLPVRCNVAFVLANPYNFTLNIPADELEFVVKNNDITARGLVIRGADNAGKGTDFITAGILRTDSNTTETSGLLDMVKFTVPSAFTIEPGETVTLGVEGNSTSLSSTNAPLDEPTNTVALSVRTTSNPLVSSDYFTGLDTLDFTTPSAGDYTGSLGIALYQYGADLSLTMRSQGTLDTYQRIEHFEVNKDNQLNSFTGLVLGSAHLKFIAPAQRIQVWSTTDHLNDIFSYYVTARPFQDFNIRASTVTHPNVYPDTLWSYRLLGPPSYGAGVLTYAAGGEAGNDIKSAFTQDLHPAQWAEDFNDDIRQAALSGVLYDFPRRSSEQLPVLSLAQLQHANIATNDETQDGTINLQTGTPIGNSYFNPFVTRSQSIETRDNNFSLATSTGSSTRYFDLSYLLNTALWDSYFFSGIPQSGSDYEPSNLRYALDDAATSSEARSADSAASLTVQGAFNINSTSQDAWAAVLGGLNGLRVYDDVTDDGVPFPRTLWQPQDSVKNGDNSYQTSGTGDDAYAGYRRLTGDEIDLLAGEIVKRVRARGPFVSLAHFINRTLVTASSDFNSEINDADGAGNLASSDVPQGQGLSGPLQAAIDSTAAGINTFVSDGGDVVEANAGGDYGDRVLFNGEVVNSDKRTPNDDNERIAYFSDKIYDAPHTEWDMDETANPGPYGRTTTGSAAWLMQADVLQAIGSALSARSDTFVIRSYGEVVDPFDSSRKIAGAWCEAVVQRTIDYVDSSDDVEDDYSELSTNNERFGRSYRIVDFRWLSADEI
jgi:Tfp pilus assembly protein PilX